jgi:hypothetical protein
MRPVVKPVVNNAIRWIGIKEMDGTFIIMIIII